MALHPVPITTPDGVGRVMRLTHGAQKRFSDHLWAVEVAPSPEMAGIYNLKFISNNLVDLAFYMLFDEQGKPPADLTLDSMREMYSPDDPELFGAVCEALSKGRKKKEEMALMIQELETKLNAAMDGSKPGPLPVSILESKGRRRRPVDIAASSGISTQAILTR